MAQFDLSNYETVKERKKRFFTDFEDGRIVVEIVNIGSIKTEALFVCRIFKNVEDQKNNLPLSTGYAYEVRILDKPLNKYGKEYEPVNYTSWVENCEESAIGRALDNAGYSGNNKCSREEMEKAGRMAETLEKDQKQSEKPKFRLDGTGGDYCIPFGSKYNGKKVKDIKKEELRAYIDFLEESAKKEGKDLGAAKGLIEAYHDFYGQLV